MAQALNIAGGGPAGLACGIRLLLSGRSVTVHEQGRYPLRKVCGEFLSPRAWQRVQALGGDRHLKRAPRPLARARFYADSTRFSDFALRPQALGLRRAALDSALAARFRALGGRLQEGSAWPGKGAPHAAPDLDARGRLLGQAHGAWFAWKAYLPAGAAPADLEAADLLMLPLPGGYAGLSWVEDSTLSVCLIARRPASLAELLSAHPVLAAVAGQLKVHAAISGFSLSQRGQDSALGDRRRVWPPLVGDGIHRALASGEAAARALLGQGRPGPDLAALQFPLALGLHYGMLHPRLRSLALAGIREWPALGTGIYRWTRF